MANRVRRASQTADAARRSLIELGAELREARLAAGLRQSDVARALGVSHTQVWRVEAARNSGARLRDLIHQARALGLALSLRVYPVGDRLRDQAQLALIRRLVSRISATWRVSLEAPVAGPGDLRAFDVLLTGPSGQVAVEAITRLRDVQAQVRAVRLKQRDAGVPRLVIVVANTHANCRELAGADDLLTHDFPMRTRALMAALVAGRVPAADGIALL